MLYDEEVPCGTDAGRDGWEAEIEITQRLVVASRLSRPSTVPVVKVAQLHRQDRRLELIEATV